MPTYTIRAQGADRSTEFDLDDAETYHINLSETSWGEAMQPEPQETMTAEGGETILPMDTAYQRRTITLVGSIVCSSYHDKLYQLSRLPTILKGRRTVRRHGWEIDVFGMTPRERSESKQAAHLILYECVMHAAPPFWELAVPLDEIQYSSLLYGDFGIPYGEAQPSYIFDRDPDLTTTPPEGAIAANPGSGEPHFTIDNWGTAYTHPNAAITGATGLTEIYLKGHGMRRVRVAISGGNGTLTDTMRFFLRPGLNDIRIEAANGTAINLTSLTDFRIDFGDTILRYQ